MSSLRHGSTSCHSARPAAVRRAPGGPSVDSAAHSCRHLPASETSPLPPLTTTSVHGRLSGPGEKHRPGQVTRSESAELRFKPPLATSGPFSAATLPPSGPTPALIRACPQRQTWAIQRCHLRSFPEVRHPSGAESTRSVCLTRSVWQRGAWRRGGGHRTPCHLPPIYPPAWHPTCRPALLSSVYLSVNLSFRLSCHLSPVSLCVRAAHGPCFLTPFKRKSEHIWASQAPSLSP